MKPLSFSVKARTPGRPMTVAEWVAWRKAEDDRMWAAVLDAIHEFEVGMEAVAQRQADGEALH